MDKDLRRIAKKIVDMIYNEKKARPEPYDTTATVRRVENGRAFVHIPGGVDETPVKLTINAEPGDNVQVRVAGGRAWIAGNESNPPTDDTTARKAQNTATKAQNTADAAEEEAGTAKVEAAEARQTAGTAETKADTALSQVGASITTDTLHYLATDLDSGVTTSTSGWTTTVQSITSALPYLWTYHTYHKASGQSVNTQPVITGVYGDTGATGPQGPAGQQGEQGPAGSDGDDGISVTAVQPQYYLSTSDQSVTGGSWSNTLSYETGKYIWTRDAITYSNSTTGYSTQIYNEALTTACSTSEQALNVAEGVNEHFWHDNTGAHVTEDTQEDYQQDPTNAGGNTLITSQGMAIRKGTKELASFGQNSIILGEQDGNHMQINRDKLGYYADDVTVATTECNYGYDEDEDVGEKTMELKVISPYRTDDRQKSSLILRQDYVSGVNHPNFAKLQAIDDVYNTEVSVTAEIDATTPTLYLKCKNALFAIKRDSMNLPLGDFNGDINISAGKSYKINNTSIFDLIYPVGSIYMSVNSTNPGTLMAGTTWQRITGRFLLAATDGGSSGASQAAGNTGGAATVTLTAAQSGLPSHTHGIGSGQAFIRYNQTATGQGVQERSVASGASGNYKAPVVNSSSVDFSYVSTTGSEGGDNASSAHNNMPPYLAVYVWKRTA